MNHDGSAAVAVSFGWIRDLGFPHDFAGARVQRDQMHVGGGEIDLVLIQREAADGAEAVRQFRTDAVFPDQIWPVRASSACTMLPGLARYMMPLWTMGVGSFAALLSFIAQDQAS